MRITCTLPPKLYGNIKVHCQLQASYIFTYNTPVNCEKNVFLCTVLG